MIAQRLLSGSSWAVLGRAPSRPNATATPGRHELHRQQPHQWVFERTAWRCTSCSRVAKGRSQLSKPAPGTLPVCAKQCGPDLCPSCAGNEKRPCHMPLRVVFTVRLIIAHELARANRSAVPCSEVSSGIWGSMAQGMSHSGAVFVAAWVGLGSCRASSQTELSFGSSLLEVGAEAAVQVPGAPSKARVQTLEVQGTFQGGAVFHSVSRHQDWHSRDDEPRSRFARVSMPLVVRWDAVVVGLGGTCLDMDVAVAFVGPRCAVYAPHPGAAPGRGTLRAAVATAWGSSPSRALVSSPPLGLRLSAPWCPRWSVSTVRPVGPRPELQKSESTTSLLLSPLAQFSRCSLALLSATWLSHPVCGFSVATRVPLIVGCRSPTGAVH